jgi:hypothetical protein
MPKSLLGITTENLVFLFFQYVQASDVFYPIQYPVQPDRVTAPVEDVIRAQFLHRTLRLGFAPGQRGGDIRIQAATKDIPTFGDFGGKYLDFFSFFGLPWEDSLREGRNTAPPRTQYPRLRARYSLMFSPTISQAM